MESAHSDLIYIPRFIGTQINIISIRNIWLVTKHVPKLVMLDIKVKVNGDRVLN